MNGKSVSCEEIRMIIESLSPKTMEKTAQKEFKEHLTDCAQCRMLYEKNLALNKLLDQWETVKPEKNLQARIMAKVAQIERERARGARSQDFWDQLKSLLGYRFSVPAFATILLIVFLLGSVAINIALVSRSSEPARVARGIPGVELEATQIAKRTSDIVEPSPGPQVVVKQPVVSVHGRDVFEDYLSAAAAYQQPLIVIIGVPPMVPGQPISSPQKIHTIQNLNKEELL